MDSHFPVAGKDAGFSLDRYDHKLTIRDANFALSRARKEGISVAVAMALIQLAHLHFRQGHYGQTQELAQEVLRDSPPDSLERCDALRMLGNCAAESGEPDLAEVYYHQTIDLARQMDYHYELYKCLHSLATNIYWPHGLFDLCMAAGKEALLQAQVLDLGEELWFPLSDIGWVYWSTGQRLLANQVADQMQAVVTPGSLGEGFYCCLRAGQVEPGEGFLSRVLPLYDRARSIAEATGDPGLNVEVRLGLCRSYRAIKDFPVAMSWAADAVAVAMRLNYRQFQGVVLIERGRTALEMGSLVKAESDLREALEISRQLRASFDLARASLYLAALLSAQKRPESAAAWQHAVGLILDHGFGCLLEQERSLVLPWIAETLNASDLQLSEMGNVLFDLLMHLPPPPLVVKTFGQFSLQVGSNPVAKEGLRQRRAGELLALLLSSPGYSLSAEQVTEAMCPEKDPSAGTDFYHHAISALRRLLEPDLPDRRFPCRYLDVSEERVTLILPPGSNLDFLDFEQQIQKKDWGRATTLYRGEYLPMFCYAEWAIGLRQHFADLNEQALLAQAEEKLNKGDSHACLDLAQQVLLHNAWQEQAVELGMRAALALDDRVSALKLYRRIEKSLAKELGITPQKELQDLYRTAQKHSG